MRRFHLPEFRFSLTMFDYRSAAMIQIWYEVVYFYFLKEKWLQYCTPWKITRNFQGPTVNLPEARCSR